VRDFKKYREARYLAGATALEISKASGINRSQLSLYESGAVKLRGSQLARLQKAVIAAILRRMAKLRTAVEILNKGITQKEAIDGVGARIDGEEIGNERRPEF
jgi:transcriptional regulator with XRE-family HTH domain